jgi:hypothetical protein
LNIWFNSARRNWLICDESTVGAECNWWFGVTCDDSQTSSINLEGNNVQGVLPADISMMTGLVIF